MTMMKRGRQPSKGNAGRKRARANSHEAYFNNLERRLRQAVDSGANAYVLNRNKGPFNKAEIKWSNSMKRLILKNIQTTESERRKGHLKRLLNTLNRIATNRGLHSVEIQSILSPHVRAMLPWRGFPGVHEYGVSSIKRYRAPSNNPFAF